MSLLRLVLGSCVEQNVDVVVNAANKFLLPGGGVCGAIFQKAGYASLDEACKRIATPLQDGDAVITPSFGITNAKAIIHAVGPDFRVHPKAFDKLQLAYYHSLILLKENGYHSIAFPLISAGIFSGELIHPASESTLQCMNACRQFDGEFPEYDIEVLICAYSPEDILDAKRVFPKKDGSLFS